MRHQHPSLQQWSMDNIRKSGEETKQLPPPLPSQIAEHRCTPACRDPLHVRSPDPATSPKGEGIWWMWTGSVCLRELWKRLSLLLLTHSILITCKLSWNCLNINRYICVPACVLQGYVFHLNTHQYNYSITIIYQINAKCCLSCSNITDIF